MEIIHKITLNASEEDQRTFREFDIRIGLGLVNFQVSEIKGQWEAIEPILRKLKAVDTAITQYSKAEVESANYFAIFPSWHHGYPQPSSDFGYINETYDTTNYCDECGVGLRQKSLFCMLREPEWGHHSILQLNWVFDELFVKRGTWSECLKDFEIELLPVMHYKKSAELKSVEQISIAFTSELDLHKRSFEECLKCRRVKYSPDIRGFYPLPSKKNLPAIFKSEEYFGTGKSAHRVIFISRALFLAISAAGLRGIEYRPCK